MATVASLEERIRDLLDDYGSSRTILAAAIADTTTTTISVKNGRDIEEGDWITVEGETMEVVEVLLGAPDKLTVVRGARGSTAATHSNSLPVRVQLAVPPARIVNALNLAQAAGYPEICSVVDDTSLSIVASQYLYAVPATIDHVRQVWIETSTSGVYNLITDWDMYDASYVHLYTDYTTGRTIKLVGTAMFDAMTYAGSQDSSFPTDNNATGYLIYEAAAQLISEQQLPVSRRDGFKGITDSFAANSPTISLATGERYRQIAQRYLREASRNIVIPELTEPQMGRFYERRI